MDPMESALLPLRDIHLPNALDWWPFAPGWWGLALLATTALIATVLLQRRRARLRLRARALEEIGRIRTRHSRRPDPHRVLQELSELLRRVALSRADEPNQPSRTEIAALHGVAWREFLGLQTESAEVSGRSGELLTIGVFRGDSDFNVHDLIDTVQAWVETMATPHA